MDCSPGAYPQDPHQQEPLAPGVPGWPVARHQAVPAARQRSRRALFWVFVALHGLMVLMLIGAGSQQTFDTTFDIFGIWAALDVILAAGFALWRWTAPPRR